MKTYATVFLSIFIILISTPSIDVLAQSVPDDRAQEVFDEFDERRRAITYETSTLEMQIIDSRERVRKRSMNMYSYNNDGVSKSLTVFDEPADVRGTSKA